MEKKKCAEECLGQVTIASKGHRKGLGSVTNTVENLHCTLMRDEALFK